MLIYSMSVSADGFVNDRDGGFDWNAPSDDVFQLHYEEVSSLSAYFLGRRLYEAMRVWETDPAFRETDALASFADVWTALPKIVFSRTLERVGGNARLADKPLAEELTAWDSATAIISIAGPTLAREAVELDLVDEYRIFRSPIIVGGGTKYLPTVASPLPLDLVESRTFDSPVVYERYRRIR